ncbi:hypothetical protein SAMN05216184_10489 [Georgenia satyanarayanai]|uniref:Uncharacterized protein n=1 Tax=Georgenia satyanarayanai TaxID=860221 RepID=A0A2Y9A7D6_9MICO|nr:hypothetical protein [Georgenia satyanarayanai]PYG00150.1 hypothetical protein A8987_10489 [Georgenia satyanarayanai]SSA40354.1 hypothetical protein SAMN05216184_10489 [Georgenia satyanarayanai]
MLGEIAVLATAFGLGTILTKLVDRLLDRRKGRIQDEQTAWEQRDAEARQRRRLEEALHETRQMLADHGVDYDDMPTWPSRTAPPQ